jgi:hypothetical protein
MNKTELMNKVTRAVNKTGLKLKKHSPEILIAAGVVSGIATVVLACKATLKVNNVVDEAKDNIEKIHEAVERGYTDAGEDYTPDDSKKDLAIVYAQTGVKFAKLYGPAFAMGVLSIASVCKSHNILSTRNAALAAAYTAVDTGFKEYRGRLVERFGKDLDRELKYNIKAKEVEEVVVKEDGTQETVTKTIDVTDPNTISEFARFFDDGCLGWDKDAEYNLTTLLQVQRFANDKLKQQGFLFLNEVYEMLGIPKTRAGNEVGWVYDEKNPQGDNWVDFGIHDSHRPQNRDFVNGYERVILLDFNIDGYILDLIK